MLDLFDHGWTYMHDQGRLLVEEELGDLVETTYVDLCLKVLMLREL